MLKTVIFLSLFWKNGGSRKCNTCSRVPKCCFYCSYQMLLEKNLRLTITISKKIVPACAFVQKMFGKFILYMIINPSITRIHNLLLYIPRRSAVITHYILNFALSETSDRLFRGLIQSLNRILVIRGLILRVKDEIIDTSDHSTPIRDLWPLQR